MATPVHRTGVPVYSPAFMVTRYTYLWKDSPAELTWNTAHVVYYYYYYYYRKKRFRWHNVKWLQGHLTNTKQNSMSAMQQNEQSIY